MVRLLLLIDAKLPLKRPGPASILKACAKGGPARPGSEAARPARDLKDSLPI